MGNKTYAVIVPKERKNQDYFFLSFDDLYGMPMPYFHEDPVLYTKEETMEVVACMNGIFEKESSDPEDSYAYIILDAVEAHKERKAEKAKEIARAKEEAKAARAKAKAERDAELTRQVEEILGRKIWREKIIWDILLTYSIGSLVR